MSTRIFVDSSVLLFAVGATSAHREACRGLVAAAAEARCELHASVEAIQEVVFHRMRRESAGRAVATGRGFAEAAVLHPFDRDVLRRALVLVDTTSIRGRDAVHAATAMAHGFDAIVTTDRDLAGVPGLEVVDPAEALVRI